MDDVRETLQAFAEKHGLILEDQAQVGFGRPCVGFTDGERYIDYNPLRYPDMDSVFPDEWLLEVPAGVSHAYHKHACMAVLVQDENYDAALTELAAWVDDWERIGVVVVEYFTGATGIQALISGVTAKAFRRSADIERIWGE